MSLPAVLKDLGLDFETTDLVKLGPRKSAELPAAWVALPEAGPGLFLKVAPVDAGDAPARLEREAVLLEQVDALDSTDPIRERVPTLRAEGTAGGLRYLALDLVDEPCAEPRVRRRFERRPADLLPWLGERLAWLRQLQTHQHLRRHLDLEEDEVLVHGDYSHYNFLESASRVVVVDWEDWSVDRRPWLDALHCVVLPALGVGDARAAAAGLRRHLLEEGAYARGARLLLEPFLGGLALENALPDYLRFQEELCARRAPDLAERFAACRREVHGPASR